MSEDLAEKLAVYICGEDLAQLVENIERVVYAGWGAVEIRFYNHEVEGLSVRIDSKGKRRRGIHHTLDNAPKSEEE